MYYDVIFSVLVYKNANDLSNFIKSVEDNCKFSYKIIVVNSYFDDATMNDVQKVADSYKCDFLNVPNKGYGAGNNRAVEFAKEKYDFKFLVISNPDILVKDFDISGFSKLENQACIIAPNIITPKGKKLNPQVSYQSTLAGWLEYIGCKHNFELCWMAGIAINKFLRCFLLHKKRNFAHIVQAHGCFLVITKIAIDKLLPIYDENVFLNCEELDLANKSKKLKTPTIFVKNNLIIHNESGSMKLSNVNGHKEWKKSYIYIYEKWHSKN